MLKQFLILLLFAIFIFLVGLLKKFINNNGNTEKEYFYLKKDYLLTQAEKQFYFILSEVLENNYLIFSKVRLLDLLFMPKGTANRIGHVGKVQSKHVDFLICDKQNIKPLLVIELDDSSHSLPNRIKRDDFVDKILGNAKLPILHISVSRDYDKVDLLNKIRELIDKGVILA